MEPFAPWSALLGGAMIGLGASLLLLTSGRVFGVSGLYSRALTGRDGLVPLAVVAGLLAAGAVAGALVPGAFDPPASIDLRLAAAAGLKVGCGTRMGGGCTSGHGVCGVSRLSPRSLVASCVFVATGIATVYAVRHIAGGS